MAAEQALDVKNETVGTPNLAKLSLDRLIMTSITAHAGLLEPSGLFDKSDSIPRSISSCCLRNEPWPMGGPVDDGTCSGDGRGGEWGPEEGSSAIWMRG